MQHGPRRGARVRPKHRDEIRLGIALVQEEGLVPPLGEAKLQLECTPLLGWRREIPEIVEPAFAGRDDHRVGRAVRRAVPTSLVLQARRMVRVHARGRAKMPGMLPAERDGPVRVVERAAGHDHRHDAGGAGALEDASRSASKLSCARLAPMSTRVGRHRAPPRSSGAERRRHGLARGPKRRQESADHADHDGDDEALLTSAGVTANRNTICVKLAPSVETAMLLKRRNAIRAPDAGRR